MSRLAVMPSTIENSSLAVYEAAICGIPFIASATGGTPELVQATDHAQVLCDPHPIPLAARMHDAVQNGAYLAAPTFDNDRNVQTWFDFHDALGRGLQAELLARVATGRAPPDAARKANGTAAVTAVAQPSIDVCLFSRRDLPSLDRTLGSLAAQEPPPNRILVAVDAIPSRIDLPDTLGLLARKGVSVSFSDAADFDAGLAHNTLAKRSSAEYLLFLEEGATLVPAALGQLAKVAASRQVDVLTYFHRIDEADGQGTGRVVAELVGSASQAFCATDDLAMPLLVRRAVFERLGGFTVDYRIPMHDREFLVKALLSAARCETVPIVLGTIPARAEAWYDEQCYNVAAGKFRAVRPYLAAAPLAFRELLLYANGQSRLVQKLSTQVRAGKGAGVAQVKRPRQIAAELASMIEDGQESEAIFSGSEALQRGGSPLRRKGGTPTPAVSAIDDPKRLGKSWLHDASPLGRKGGAPTPAESASDDPKRLGKSWLNDASPLGRKGGTVDRHKSYLDDPTLLDGAQVSRKPTRAPSIARSRLLSNGVPLEQSDRYALRVLDVRHGLITGVAIDKEIAGKRVEIEARYRGWRLGRSQPIAPLADLALPAEETGSLFEIRLGGPLHLLGNFVPSRMIDLHAVETGEVIGRLQAVPVERVASVGQSAFIGYCSGTPTGEINGWVWSPHDASRRLHVAVYVDGRWLCMIRADALRGDVRKAGHGDGRYGFALALPQAYRSGQRHEVDMLVAGEGVRLQGAPLIVVGNTVTTKPKQVEAVSALVARVGGLMQRGRMR